jgi:ABC-type antimicrobial peptide transport system ATPase subunit
MTDDADRAATALIAAFRTLAASQPGKHQLQAAPGVISLMSGLPIGTLNGAFTDAARPAPPRAWRNCRCPGRSLLHDGRLTRPCG